MDAPTSAATALRLDVRNLEVRLQSGPDVVKEVTFSVSPGEILGLVGESGSGKSTVALALLGHVRRGLRIAGGSVRLDGTELIGMPPAQLRALRGSRVAYVPQDPSAALNPLQRIGTQLREALIVHREMRGRADDRIREVLEETRLAETTEVLRRFPHELSGGQLQRVALAMAFACRPSLIVLDEPTTGLDVSTQRHVLDTIRALCQIHGVAAVCVSHDLAVVSGLANAVAVMYAGRVIERGPMATVFSSPSHPYTRGLLNAVPSPDRAELLAGIDGQPPQPGRRPAGCSFASRCGYVVARCLIEAPAEVIADGRGVRCHRASEVLGVAPRGPGWSSPPRLTRPAVLSVSGLSAYYGHAQVLTDVNLDLQRESCLAIVGESGSGKTTLAKCIVGLHRNWRGSVNLGELELAAGVRRRPADALKRVQYVFQNPFMSLNPRKTIGQIVAQPLEQFFDWSLRERSERAVQALADVSLDAGFMSKFPDQLSGGERQRVAIARALAVEPDVLVCDEVTSALDVSVQAVIVELLRRLQDERRLSMIFITHNLALVRSIAQSVVVLQRGTIRETGTAEAVLSEPQDPYTKRLIEDVPRLLAAPGSA